MKAVERINRMIVVMAILAIPVFCFSQSLNQNQSQFEESLTKKIYKFSFSNELLLKDDALLKGKSLVPLQKSYYKFEELALFCKFEEKVAQNSKVAMRFRLGSLGYVDQLENKPYTKIKN